MLKNELVQVKKGEIFTTSDLIAKKLDAKHTDILKTIKNVIEKIDSSGSTLNFGEKYVETEFEHNKTKIKYPGYFLNEEAFQMLVFQLSRYKRAFEIQRIFVKQFSQMKEALQNQSNNSWLEAREGGKTLRKLETDIIKQLTDYAEKERGKPVTYPLYSTYTKMTNKHLQFIVDCKDGKPIRDLASVRDLGFIGIVDDRCKQVMIDGMNRGLPYKEIYRYCKEEVSKLVSTLDFKPKAILK